MLLMNFSRIGFDNPELEGPRIVLRPPEMVAWKEWATLRMVSREFLAPWEPTWSPKALSRAHFRRYLRTQHRASQAGKSMPYFVYRRDDEKFIGSITIGNIQRGVSQKCSVGYWIGSAYSRSGFMTESLNCILSHCIYSLGLNRVEAACMPANIASRALLNQCGFKCEGYARKLFEINGIWEDHLLFAVVAEDYKNFNPT